MNTMFYSEFYLAVPSSGRIYHGPCPFDDVLSELAEKGVSVVWNLGKELSDIAENERKFFPIVIHSKVQDYSVPESKEEFLADLHTVAEHIRNGRSVFIHCMGGHGRTGMALASLAIVLRNKTPEVALRLSKLACRGPEMDSQVDFVKALRDA